LQHGVSAVTEDIAYLIEIPHIYDGWSVKVLTNGTKINRWDPEQYPWRHQKTQEYLEAES
jgi:hypothetical protein